MPGSLLAETEQATAMATVLQRRGAASRRRHWVQMRMQTRQLLVPLLEWTGCLVPWAPRKHQPLVVCLVSPLVLWVGRREHRGTQASYQGPGCRPCRVRVSISGGHRYLTQWAKAKAKAWAWRALEWGLEGSGSLGRSNKVV